MLAMFCTAQVADGALVLDFTNSTPTFNIAGPGLGTTFSNLDNSNNLVIRWAAIANNGVTDIDLVATVSGTEGSGGNKYRANDEAPGSGFPPSLDSRVYLNGLSGTTADGFRYGRINLRHDHAATFTFTLVDPNNGDSAVVADFDFSVLDLDTGLAGGTAPQGGMESVQLISQDGTATWQTSASTELSSTYTTTSPAADWTAPAITPTQPFFGATTAGIGGDNPTDPLNLSPQQADRTVEFGFVSTSTFNLRLGMGPSAGTGGALSQGGRNFLLTGASAVAVVPEPASVSLVAVCGLGLLLTRRKKKCQSAAGIETES
jgi:hypothetical protein